MVQGGAYSVTLLSDVADEFSGDVQEGKHTLLRGSTDSVVLKSS